MRLRGSERPEMRKDSVSLAKQAVDENRRLSVLRNNRSEGHAPLMVQPLSDLPRTWSRGDGHPGGWRRDAWL